MPTIDDAFIKVYSKRSSSLGADGRAASASAPAPATNPSIEMNSQPVQRLDAAHAQGPVPRGRYFQAPVNSASGATASHAQPQATAPHFSQVHVEVVGFDQMATPPRPLSTPNDALSIEYARLSDASSVNARPAAPVSSAPVASMKQSAPYSAPIPLFETHDFGSIPTIPAIPVPPSYSTESRSARTPREERIQRVDLGEANIAAPHEREVKFVQESNRVPLFDEAETVSSSTKKDSSVTFQPVWEVDAFGWPDTIEKLAAHASKTLRDAGRALHRASQDGLRILCVTSLARGQGRTTVAMQLARAAAQSGLRVALVDADTECPVLADRMCVEVTRGWIDAAGDGLPLEEVAIYALDDRITLLPLVPWTGGGSKTRESTVVIRKALRHLARTHDLVIMDNTQLGGLGTLFPDAEHPMIDAALLVCDLRNPDDEARDAGIARLQRLGIRQIGIVENFVETSVG